MMDWYKAAKTTIERWDAMASLLAAREREAEFKKLLLETCGMCEMSRQEISELGPPKVKLDPCDFCRFNLDAGGCAEPKDLILASLDRGDREAAIQEVDRVRETLRSLVQT